MQKRTRSIWTHHQSRTKPRGLRDFIAPFRKEDRTADGARPEDNDEPRGEWQQTNRARPVHATTCRRPSESCAVNDVHKFRIYSGSHEWPAAQLGAVTPSSEWANLQSKRQHRLNLHRDASAPRPPLTHRGSTTPAGISSGERGERIKDTVEQLRNRVYFIF